MVLLLLSRGVDCTLRGDCGLAVEGAVSGEVREILEWKMSEKAITSDGPSSDPALSPLSESDVRLAEPSSAPKRVEADMLKSQIPKSTSESNSASVASIPPEEDTTVLIRAASVTIDRERLRNPGVYKYAIHKACQRGEFATVKDLVKRRVSVLVFSTYNLRYLSISQMKIDSLRWCIAQFMAI